MSRGDSGLVLRPGSDSSRIIHNLLETDRESKSGLSQAQIIS